MLTQKLTPEQVREIKEAFDQNLTVRPHGQKWQLGVRTGRVDGRGLVNFQDELRAFILRDELIAGVMEILEHANRPRISFGDPA